MTETAGEFKKSVFRIFNTENETIGTGFLVDENLAVTCAHVVERAGSQPGGTLKFAYHADTSSQKFTATVLTQGWSHWDQEDVAFLRVENPLDFPPLRLYYSAWSDGHPYRSLGYPAGRQGAVWASDWISGLLKDQPFDRLQIMSNHITHGFSGAPVLDLDLDRVVGMVRMGYEDKNAVEVYAIPIETLHSLYPKLVVTSPDESDIIEKRTGVFTSPCVDQSEVFGREAEVAQVIQFLQGPAEPGKAFFYIRGAPGIGKSVLAAAAWHQVKDTFTLLWVCCSQYTRLNEIWPEVARLMGEPEMNIGAFAARLKTEKILLVLDGADTLPRLSRNELLPDTARLLSLLSPEDAGKVVLTACASSGLPKEKWLELGPLSLAAAQALFLKQWGKPPVDISALALAQVQAICSECLGGNPQFIQWAGLQAQTISLGALQHMFTPPGASASSRHIAIHTILKCLTTDQRRLLERLALLGSRFGDSELQALAAVEPPVSDVPSARQTLCQLHLIQTNSTDFQTEYSLFSNVRLYLWKHRIQKDPHRYQSAKAAAARCLLQSSALPDLLLGLGYALETQQWAAVLFHTRRAFGIHENERLFSPDDESLYQNRAQWALAYLYNQMGKYRNAITKAEAAAQALVQLEKTQFDLWTAALALRVNCILGFAYQELGDPCSLARILLEIQRIQHKLAYLPADDRDLLQMENAQVNLLLGLEAAAQRPPDFVQAIGYMLQALQVFEEQKDRAYERKALSNLASCYYSQAVAYKQSDEDRYLRGLKQSAEISRKILSRQAGCTDDSLMAAEYANLISTLNEIQQYSEAQRVATEGERYCLQYGHNEALLSLLINAVDVETNLKQAAAATEKMHRVHQLITQTDIDVAPYELPLNLGWARIKYLEAWQNSDAGQRWSLLQEAQRYQQKACQLARASRYAEDQELFDTLPDWVSRNQPAGSIP